MDFEELKALRKTKKRALRRSILQRRKLRMKKLGRPIKQADHMGCGCWMCCNPRRNGEVTKAELSASAAYQLDRNGDLT